MAEKISGHHLGQVNLRLAVGEYLKDDPVIMASAGAEQTSNDLVRELSIVLLCGEPAVLGELQHDEVVESMGHRPGQGDTGVSVGRLLSVHLGLRDSGRSYEVRVKERMATEGTSQLDRI